MNDSVLAQTFKIVNLSTGEPNAMTSSGLARYNVGGVIGLNT
jgi:hypothetical protein